MQYVENTDVQPESSGRKRRERNWSHINMHDKRSEINNEDPESCGIVRSDWKKRYSNLYGTSTSKLAERKEDECWQRISFMSNDNKSYNALLTSMRASRRDLSTSPSPRFLTSVLSEQSDLYGTYTGTGSMLLVFGATEDKTIEVVPHKDVKTLISNIENRSGHPSPNRSSGLSCSSLSSTVSDRVSNDLGIHDTLLLDMVRARSHELQQEAQEQCLDLPKDESVFEDQTSEACVHGLSMRMTDRSISRSRMSRISTRRDMDIPSILAFSAGTVQTCQPRIPAFPKENTTEPEDTPRWSIRRAVCPVCSQRWKDKSSIRNIKYSGLRRNSSSELPSIIAPARLRTAITMGYSPRPILANIDQEVALTHPLRVTSATWQLIRARRFRAPKPRLPPANATAPPVSAAPLAQRDLDQRIIQFLTDVKTNAKVVSK